jgi:zinc transporter ZupT
MLMLLMLAQVFLSHQPLSFATTVLLACALCIHSVLEGVALGAQLTMEVRIARPLILVPGGGDCSRF